MKCVRLFSISMLLAVCCALPAVAQIEITECTTITDSGSYFLSTNLSTTLGTCLTVDADQVTIDLNGFAITGPGLPTNARGIFAADRRAITIRNGSISGFDIGVLLLHEGPNGTNATVEGLHVTDNNFGIEVYSLGSIIRDNVATNNSFDGFDINSGATIAGNTAIYNRRGFGVSCPANLIGNTAVFNTLDNSIGPECNSEHNVFQ